MQKIRRTNRKIKKDPFLVTLILLILQETIDSNILSDRGKKGVLIFDEFAETQAIKDMYSGEEVIQTVAILYQKIRKENGAVYIIIQDPSQLPDNNYTAGIIANTQVLMVLPSNKGTYQEVQKKFKLAEHEMYQLLSLKNNLIAEHPYSELFLKLGEENTVVRLELPPEAFLAFQTDGEKWKQLNAEFERVKDMKQAINNLIKY
jgi:type IV secretory pathway VirB4 component